MKKILYIFISIILFLFIGLGITLSQEIDEHSFNLSPVPHSPEVSSLMKYINFPVSYYTGQANISIPIYDLQAGDISVPISLSYHTGGIKVEDIASRIGLGWTLNAGGVISRSVNGVRDDFVQKYFKMPPHTMTYTEFQNYYYAGSGTFDSQHDIFYFNVNGYTGKFVLDFENNFEPITIPQQRIKITKDNRWVESGAIHLLTPEGLEYTFAKISSNSPITTCLSGIDAADRYITDWHLTKIESLKTGHWVEFNYESASLNYEVRGVETKYHPSSGGGTKNDDKCTITNRIETVNLYSIISSTNVEVLFNKGRERCDLDNDYVLDNIEITYKNRPYKRYVFSYNYMTNRGTFEDLSLFDPDTEDNNDNIRLMLLSVEEEGYSKIKGKYIKGLQPYQFTYNHDIGLPSRFSNAQDQWGYFNGAYNNTLVPALMLGKYYEGANRMPNKEHAIQGALKSIIFPTGGVTEYSYGMNECNNYSFRYYNSEVLINREYALGKNDLSKSDKIFELERSTEVNIALSFNMESSFCSNLPCEVVLELYSLNEDNTEDEFIFSSSWLATGHEEDKDLRYEEKKLLSKGKYKLKQTINDMGWAEYGDNYYLSVQWYENYTEPPYNDNKAGGLRVEKIVTTDNTSGQIITRNFKYEDGKLSNKQKFHRIETVLRSDYCLYHGSYTVLNRSSVSNLPLLYTNGGIVGYGKVIEYKGEGDGNGSMPVGSIEYSYYTLKDHPDYIITPELWHGAGTIRLGSIEQYNEDQWEYPYPMLDSKDWKRGIPKTIKTFNSQGEPVKTVKNTYKFYDDETKTYFDSTKVKNIYGVKVGAEAATLCDGDTDGHLNIVFYRLQSSWYELDSTIETLHTSNGDISTIKRYEYGNPEHLQVTQQEIINSKGEKSLTQYTYPQDISFENFEEVDCNAHCRILQGETRACLTDCIHDCNSNECVEGCFSENCKTDINLQCGNCIKGTEFDFEACVAYCEENSLLSEEGKAIKVMVSKNMISIPLQTLEKKGDKTIGGNFTTYKELNSGAIVPNVSYNLEIDAPKSTITESHIDKAGALAMDESFKDKIHFDSYDEFGNITQVQKTGDIPTSYLWGYNNTLPVAKIVGLSYDEVKKKVSPNVIQNLTGEELSAKLTPLRELDAMVTIYTYDPLIGMTSMTDANGFTTHYEYDDFGRLKCTRDDEGNIINTYKYHYAGEE